MERIAFDDHPWFVVFNTNHGHQLSSSLRFPNVYQTYSKRQSITKLLRNSDDVYLFRSLYVRKTFEKRSYNDLKTFLKRNKTQQKRNKNDVITIVCTGLQVNLVRRAQHYTQHIHTLICTVHTYVSTGLQ